MAKLEKYFLKNNTELGPIGPPGPQGGATPGNNPDSSSPNGQSGMGAPLASNGNFLLWLHLISLVWILILSWVYFKSKILFVSSR